MQGHQCVIRQPLKKLANQIDIERANRRAGEINVERQPGPTGQVDNHAGQCLVERHISVTIATDSLFVTQRLGQGLSDGNPYILDGMVSIDMQIPRRLHLKVDQAMPRDLIEHVIEERHARKKTAFPAPIEIDANGNLSLQRVSGYFCLAHDGWAIVDLRAILGWNQSSDRMIPFDACIAPNPLPLLDTL